MIKLFVVLVFSLLYVTSVVASEARIISMGKSDAFFMDEISIFRSPGNVSMYSNMLMGDFGNYIDDPMQGNQSFILGNRDPLNPWFGGIVGLGGDPETNIGMFSMGIVVNRFDRYDTLWFSNLVDTATAGWTPQMPVDLFLGYNLGTVELGARAHVAAGKEETRVVGEQPQKRESRVVLGLIGARFQASEDAEVEISGGGTAVKIDEDLVTDNDDNSFGHQAHARVFMDINGLADAVFIGGLEDVSFLRDDANRRVYAGIGFNVLIDRGFFWFGVTGERETFEFGVDSHDKSFVGLSWGLERNFWWDWLVMRFGGRKIFGREELQVGNTTTERFFTNPDANKMPEDALGLGIGINVDDRVRIDGVIAEDVFHTFGNMMSGSLNHVITRISATLAF